MHKLLRDLSTLPIVRAGTEVPEKQVLFQHTAEDSKAFWGFGCSVPIKFSTWSSSKSSTKLASVQMKVYVEHIAHHFTGMVSVCLNLIFSTATGQCFLPTNKICLKQSYSSSTNTPRQVF